MTTEVTESLPPSGIVPSNTNAHTIQTSIATSPESITSTKSGIDPITAIRAKVTTIVEQAPQYIVKEKELMGESTEGGVIKGFYSGSELKKVTAILYGEMGKRIYEYYYDDGVLIFAYDETQQYDGHIFELAPGEAPTVASKIGQRFYFDGGEMVQWINGDAEIITDTTHRDYASWALAVKELDARWREALQ